jgi:hypothetical protein
VRGVPQRPVTAPLRVVDTDHDGLLHRHLLQPGLQLPAQEPTLVRGPTQTSDCFLPSWTVARQGGSWDPLRVLVFGLQRRRFGPERLRHGRSRG